MPLVGLYPLKDLDSALTLFTNPRRFPSVRHIRLLGFKAVMKVLALETWEKWDQRMRELRYRFDDENGVRLAAGQPATFVSSLFATFGTCDSRNDIIHSLLVRY